jgi:hypothetical protein
MRGENGFAGYAGQSLVEAESFVLHAVSNRFEYGKRAVSFVEMKNARRNAHGLQRSKAADTEQQLLTDSDAAIAAIQTRGELAVLRRVSFDVGIHRLSHAIPSLESILAGFRSAP